MNLLQEGWVWWAVAVAVAVPVALVVLTEIINHYARRGSKATEPLRLLRNWVIPAAALTALLFFAFQYDGENAWPRVVATVLGFLLILLVLSSFNVAIFATAKSGSWRERVPTIFVEITRLLLVVVGLALLFQWVWGADVGGLITALGVTSIVLGLALQNAIGGVVLGLLLLFEQPFKMNDWLQVGGVEGRVVEMNWRSVHLDTGSGIQIIPNSSLSGASFTNLSQPAGAHHVSADLKFTTDDPPHEVIELLVEVADSLPMQAQNERAEAAYTGNGGYRVTLAVDGPGVAQQALSLYLAWLWYAARRRGLALDGDSTDPIQEPRHLENALGIVGPTLHVGADDRELLLSTARLERYGTGEIVLRQGVVPDEIAFIVDGHARLAVEVKGGRLEFATVDAGDYIGQTALTRERTLTTAIAADVLTVMTVPLETVDALVNAHPALADEIGKSIDWKRKLASEALASAGIVEGTLGIL